MNNTTEDFLTYKFNSLDRDHSKLELVEILRGIGGQLLIANGLDTDPLLSNIETTQISYDNEQSYRAILELKKLADDTLNTYKSDTDVSWIEPFVLSAKHIAGIL